MHLPDRKNRLDGIIYDKIIRQTRCDALRFDTLYLRYNRRAMPRRKKPEDLSVEELRRLLIEKRRGVRRERLEHFRKTGRVVDDVAPPESVQAVDEPPTGSGGGYG